MPTAASVPAPPSATSTENAAGRPRAQVGDVGGEEGDHGERPGERHAEQQRSDADHDAR